MYCVICNTVGNDGNYCKDCGGKTVFSRFPCPYCKAPNYPSAKFCEHCGKPVQEAGREWRTEVKDQLLREAGKGGRSED